VNVGEVLASQSLGEIGTGTAGGALGVGLGRGVGGAVGVGVGQVGSVPSWNVKVIMHCGVTNRIL
jgi:hypothetical protein